MRCSAIPVRPPVFPPELDRLAEKVLKHSAHGDHAETSSDRRQIRAMRQTVSRGACHLDLFVQLWGKSAHSPKHLGANGGRERALIPKLSPSWRLRDGPQVVLPHSIEKLLDDNPTVDQTLRACE